MRTWLGLLARDVSRKTAGVATTVWAAFARPLDLVTLLLRPRRESRGCDKFYSLHAPAVNGIGMGKAQTRKEFG